MDRTTLWRCYHHHRRDGLTPVAAGEEEESAPWPQLPRSSQRQHVVARWSANPRAPPAADRLCW